MAKFNIPDTGFEDSEFDLENLNNVEQVLLDFGNEMQEKLRASIDQGGKFGRSNDSGNLKQSINFTTTIKGERFIFQLKLADYYDYVNKGVKGKDNSIKAPSSPYKFGTKPPPVSSIELWARKKGLNPFAVAKAIHKNGIYGNGFYDRVVTSSRLKQLTADLGKASAKDAKIIITKNIQGVFGASKIK